ncbi:MAG: potassium-transporting ATPase subunit B, partial [Desulfomonile tiedjei]|nr:potassium-transporting ATPase subunit B [Desulfomonile tiedjei]
MARKTVLFGREIFIHAVIESFGKLDPRHMLRNPVMFVTETGAVITTVAAATLPQGESLSLTVQVAVWLWFTVLFANFAEALAEGRGKAQANALRRSRATIMAHLLVQDGLF